MSNTSIRSRTSSTINMQVSDSFRRNNQNNVREKQQDIRKIDKEVELKNSRNEAFAADEAWSSQRSRAAAEDILWSDVPPARSDRNIGNNTSSMFQTFNTYPKEPVAGGVTNPRIVSTMNIPPSRINPLPNFGTIGRRDETLHFANDPKIKSLGRPKKGFGYSFSRILMTVQIIIIFLFGIFVTYGENADPKKQMLISKSGYYGYSTRPTPFREDNDFYPNPNYSPGESEGSVTMKYQVVPLQSYYPSK